MFNLLLVYLLMKKSMKKLYIYVAGVTTFAVSPLLVSAQLENIEGLMGTVLDLLGILVLIIIALALVFFLWGVAKFILNAGDAEAQSQGKQIMFWGIIALFVMVSVWGLVNFVGDAFNLDDSPVQPPEIPTN